MAWLYKRPDSLHWWIGWRVNGRQFLQSTGTADRKKAEQKLCELEFIEQAKRDGRLTQSFIESMTGARVPQVSLWTALEDWLTEAVASTSERTAQKYRSVAEAFREFLKASEGAPLLEDITSEEVRAYLSVKRTKTSASTVNQHRRIISVFFIRALKNGLLKSNPVLPVKTFKAGRDEQSRRRRAYTVEELKLIYSKAPDDFWRYMILGGFYCGLRLGDLICLRTASVDFEQSAIRLVASKTGRTLHIPLAAPLRALLEELRSKGHLAKPGDYLWPEQAKHYLAKGSGSFSNEFYNLVLAPCGLVRMRLNKQAAKQGRAAQREIVSVSFHSLRHSFVSLLKATSGNQAVAKELAGHSSDLVSDLYTHMPIESLRSAIAQLPEVAK